VKSKPVNNQKKKCRHVWSFAKFTYEPRKNDQYQYYDCQVQLVCKTCAGCKTRSATSAEFDAEIKQIYCDGCEERLSERDVPHSQEVCIKSLRERIEAIESRLNNVQITF
jgi:hypothetical protein